MNQRCAAINLSEPFGDAMSRTTTILFKAWPVLITFVVGVGLSALWQFLTPRQLAGSEIPEQYLNQSVLIGRVSICDLQDQPRLYENKLVSVEGVVFAIDGKFTLYEKCSNINNGAGLPIVELSGAPETFNDLHFVKGKESFTYYEADARVIGTVRRDPGVEHLGLRIETLMVEPLSGPRRLKPRGAG